MFRRKDESDIESNDQNTAPQNALSGGSAAESATVISPQHSSGYQPSQAGGGATAPSASAYSPAASGPYAPPGARGAEPVRPGAASAFRPAGAGVDMQRGGRGVENKSGAPALPGAAGAAKENRRVLTVGSDILLKGEIATCDRLVIEGKVDATLNDVHTVEIAESGSFKGTAQIEYAEISGLFEGDLIVRNRLVIYATGKVRGKITYGEIEIERGGELSGEIKSEAASTYGARDRKAAA